MMKKFKTILLTATVLMSILGSLFVGSACKDETPKAQTPDTMVALNGFESHMELDSMQFRGYLGTVHLNRTETEYIKDGNASAKVTVDGDPMKNQIPQLRQATNVKRKNLNMSDFSFVKFVSLQVYNAQPEPRKLEMHLIFDSGNGPVEVFDLQPKAWTSITYAVDREYIPAKMNVNGEKTLPVDGIMLTFTRTLGQNDVYYLDDMRLYKTSMPAMPVQMQLKEHEFCSFDYFWQTKIVERTDWSHTDIMPEFSYSSENTATGAGGSLCMRAPAGSSESIGGFAGVVFPKSYIQMFPWAEYDDNDCLTFDVYAPKGSGIKKLWFNMYGSTTTRFFYAEIAIPAGKWTTFSFPVSQINGQGTATELDYFALTSLINITYCANDVGGLVYIDNIRMEVK